MLHFCIFKKIQLSQFFVFCIFVFSKKYIFLYFCIFQKVQIPKKYKNNTKINTKNTNKIQNTKIQKKMQSVEFAFFEKYKNTKCKVWNLYFSENTKIQK